MASIFFEHADKNAANDIFTFGGSAENSVSNIESTILPFDVDSEEIQEKSFYYKDVQCKIKFIPRIKESGTFEATSIYDEKTKNSISVLFGVNSRFFIVTGKGKISEETAKSLMVELTFAFSSLKINLPFFIQIGSKEDKTFIGHQNGENGLQLAYDSHQNINDFDLKNTSNIKKFVSNEFHVNLSNDEVSARMFYETGQDEKKVAALFDFPKTKFEENKVFDISDAKTAVAALKIAPNDNVSSPLKKAVRYASSQNTNWPQSPIKPNYAKQLLSKCKEIDCERPVKGAYPGGILEHLANAMCDDSFTTLWMSFRSMINECIAKKEPFAQVKPHKNDSLLQQKINVLNAALEAKRAGKTSFYCPLCDDDKQIIQNEMRKLEAAIPTIDIQRFQEISEAIIKFRSTNDYTSSNRFTAEFEHQNQENSAITSLWEAIPSYVTDADDAIRNIVEWLTLLTPAELHAQIIIILVSSEIRRIGGEHLHSAFSQKSLSNTISKATMLTELSMLLQPLDFLKATDEISSSIIEGMIGAEMLNTVSKMFPSAPKFVDALVRNGFAIVDKEETKKQLCALFKSKGFFSGSTVKSQTTRITLTGDFQNASYKFFFTSTTGKKTIVSSTKAEIL